MAEPQLHPYKANCHCGSVKVKFAVEEAIEERTLILCNCSICTKNGYINVYARNELVEIQDEKQLLKGYSYNPHNRLHKFCTNCGTSLLIIPNDKVPGDEGRTGINIRAVENIDLDKLKYRHVDGFSRGPPYEVF